MAIATLAPLLDRAVQQRDERNRAARARLDAAARADALKPTQHAAGDRVFDTVSGQVGEVIIGTRQNVLIQAT
jgi:hypothetical protein